MLMAFAAFLLSIQLLNYHVCPVHSMTMFYPFWMMTLGEIRAPQGDPDLVLGPLRNGTGPK